MIETIRAPKNKLASSAMLAIDPIQPGKLQPIDADPNSNDMKYKAIYYLKLLTIVN